MKRNLGKIFSFAVIIFISGVVWSLIERGLLGDLDRYPSTGIPYNFTRALISTSLGSLLLGALLGTFEVVFLNRLFARRAFGVKVVAKTLIYVAALCLFLVSLTILASSLTLEVPPYDPTAWRQVRLFIVTFEFWSVIAYMGATIGIALFVLEVSDNLGQGVLKNFLTGRYHKAREEERIFMFLDMKSSTTIAERLGHVRYFALLNDYYADLTRAIVRTSGQIYQYVGDEVVVSWPTKSGLQNNNCLSCFFAMKRIFQSAAKRYTDVFGVVPGFKAGLHYGPVTVGEIGVVKREIIFTGDVLNTTARIQSLCNEHGVDILLSADLVLRLQTEGRYSVEAIGECELRGRGATIELVTIREIDAGPL